MHDGMSGQLPPVDSVLMLGQSNMAGRGDMGQVKPIRNPLCYMLRNGRWQPMCEPVNPDRGIFEGRFRSGISLAAGFADEYARYFHSPVGLIPCADGGTCLADWMPGQLLYDHAVLQTKLALRSSRLKAILWHQGESDCLSDETVASYRDRFLVMITQLRRDLDAPEVPLLIGELPRKMGESWKTQGRETRMNQILGQLAAEMPHCALVSSHDLTMKPDGAHFDSPACREFGTRYFRQYLKLTGL